MKGLQKLQGAIDNHHKEIVDLLTLYETEPDPSLKTVTLAAKVHGAEFRDQLYRILGPSLSSNGSDFDGEDEEEKSKIGKMFSKALDFIKGKTNEDPDTTNRNNQQEGSNQDDSPDDDDEPDRKILGMNPWLAGGLALVILLAIVLLVIRYGSS